MSTKCRVRTRSSKYNWFIYSLEGQLLSTARVSCLEGDILAIDLYEGESTDAHGLCMTWKLLTTRDISVRQRRRRLLDDFSGQSDVDDGVVLF